MLLKKSVIPQIFVVISVIYSISSKRLSHKKFLTKLYVIEQFFDIKLHLLYIRFSTRETVISSKTVVQETS